MSRFASWEQRNDSSCGAACLMVALNELIDYEMTEENEMSIWKTVRLAEYQGSMPGPMGEVSIKHGLQAEVVMCRSWIQRSLDRIPPQEKAEYTSLLKALDEGLQRAERAGVKVTNVEPYGDFVDHLCSRLRESQNCRVLAAIEVENSELHWVLLRSRRDDVVSVMDPAEGDNDDYSVAGIVVMSSEVGVGCSMVLTPPLE